jgi:hypothetical protein
MAVQPDLGDAITKIGRLHGLIERLNKYARKTSESEMCLRLLLTACKNLSIDCAKKDSSPQ